MTPAELQRQRDDEANWERHRSGLGENTASESDSDENMFETQVETSAGDAAETSFVTTEERMRQVRSVVERIVCTVIERN